MVLATRRRRRDDARMSQLRAITAGLVLTLVVSSCGGPANPANSAETLGTSTIATPTTSPTTSATTTPPATSVTTTTVATTTTATTTTSTTTTTVAPTTTTAPDAPPGAVQGLTVAIGGGSGEVISEWNRNIESDIGSYNLWYSDDPGGIKTLLIEIPHDMAALPPMAYNAGGDRIAYVDLRAQIEGKHCYQVSAIDAGENEGSRSVEVCLPVTPPSTPAGFAVGIGGGSGEVMVIWVRIPDPDGASYNLWYSEWPGGSKSLLASVAHDPGSLTGPAYDAGGGRTAYIDFPRMLENDRNCYQISAVDTAGNEGARTAELCLSDL